MRRSSSRWVQSGGRVSRIASKSSASGTGDTLTAARGPLLESIPMTTVAASDYDLVARSAGLVDRSERGKLLLTGAEAAEFLQGQVTNDVEALTPGTGCYAAFLSHKG